MCIRDSVETYDGSDNLGKIIKVYPDTIYFQTKFGILEIPVSSIKQIEEVPSTLVKNGEYWFPNPNATRLFFAPTGRMLKGGKGYFADYYAFFPMVAYGIRDNVTIGGGMSLLPSVDIDEQMYFLTPRVGIISRKDYGLSAGALCVKLPFEEDDSDDEEMPSVLGILYGVGTYGTATKSVTVGLGYGFEDTKLADKPMIVLGGEWRFTRRMALVTENWVIPGIDNPLLSCGVRFFGQSISVDLALVNTIGKDAFFPGIPYIDFVYNF